MALETGTYISDLTSTNPTSADPKSQGDDHIRLLKSTVKATFPNVTGAVTATHTEINRVDGITGPAAAKDGETFTGANDFTGATLTAATQARGDVSTKVATTAFVEDLGSSLIFPSQVGKSGQVLITNGTDADWATSINSTVMSFADGSSPTKQASLLLTGVTAGQNRVMTVSDEDMTLFTPYARLLYTVTATAAASLNIEPTFSSAYDRYIILIDELKVGTTNDDLRLRVKVGGSYISTNTYAFLSSARTLVTAASSALLFSTVDAGVYTNLQIEILHPLNTTYAKSLRLTGWCYGEMDYPPSGVKEDSTGALQGIQIFSSSTVTGTARVYGIRKT